MSPKVSDKVNGQQPWSLMGGLIFNPPGKYQSESNAGVEARKSNLATKGRSSNDLLGLWKDKGVILDDPEGNDSSSVNGYSTAFHDSFRRGRLLRQGSHGSDFTWTLPERSQGGSPGVPDERRLEKTPSDPAPANAVDQFIVPLEWDSMPSDGSVSNEVTHLAHKESLMVSNNTQGNPEPWELVQPQNFVSAVSQTSSTFLDWGVGSDSFRPHEGPMDSETPNGEATSNGVIERERGNVTGAAINARDALPSVSASVRSDLSRESSAELEKMLVSKVSLNILLAEDNAINQKVASRQLEKHGHVVTIVGDGQQALDVISSLHDDFDLVLMDVQVLLSIFPSPLIVPSFLCLEKSTGIMYLQRRHFNRFLNRF